MDRAWPTCSQAHNLPDHFERINHLVGPIHTDHTVHYTGPAAAKNLSGMLRSEITRCETNKFKKRHSCQGNIK